jgi:hypothetical protein
MPDTMKFSKIIAIKSMKNPLEISFLMAAGDGLRIDVSSHGVGADVNELESADSLAGREKRHINNVTHFPPRMALPPIILEQIENRRFRGMVLVENQEAIVDDSSRASLEFPVVVPLEIRIETRDNLFERLADRIDASGDDGRVRLRNDLAKKANPRVSADQIERILEQPRPFQSRQMDE